MADLSAAQEHVATCMDRILTAFKPGVKITVVVRTPGYPERDFLMTDDDLADVAKLIDRRLPPSQEPRDE